MYDKESFFLPSFKNTCYKPFVGKVAIPVLKWVMSWSLKTPGTRQVEKALLIWFMHIFLPLLSTSTFSFSLQSKTRGLFSKVCLQTLYHRKQGPEDFKLCCMVEFVKIQEQQPMSFGGIAWKKWQGIS